MSKLRQIIREEVNKIIKENSPKYSSEWTAEKKRFWNSIKTGDQVRYIGPEKNKFKTGEVYEVDHIKSNSVFEKTVVIKDGSRKLIIKNYLGIDPLVPASIWKRELPN